MNNVAERVEGDVDTFCAGRKVVEEHGNIKPEIPI